MGKTVLSLCILISVVGIWQSNAFQLTSKIPLRAGFKHDFRSRNCMMSSISELVSQAHIMPEFINHVTQSSSNIISDLLNHHTVLLSDEEIVKSVESVAATAAKNDVSIYSKVDKTGFIGTIADYVERVIDLGNSLFKSLGVENAYGLSIILFTFVVKVVTFPLAKTQIESTTKLQKLTPLQQKIQAKYARDEQTKNQLLSQLYGVANVNPLAGCFPALVQIPIFISLYRALQNLVAENKLDEPFLWIPNLEGPSFLNPPSTAMDWLKSAFTGNPSYGWPNTLAYLSIPLILFISQTISQKILSPQKNQNEMTDQEKFSQSLLNSLPLVVASFSLNVPAGLGVYWVVNNILTTLITLGIRNSVKDESLPPEVDQLMATIDAPSINRPPSVSESYQELRGINSDFKKKEKIGFGRVVDTDAVPENEAPKPVADFKEIQSTTVEPDDSSVTDQETDDVSSSVNTEESSRKKKRVSLRKEKKRR